ncbi:DUF4253 domain-containing protein [Pseudoflavonifractor phocaeensis]|uniref:DUF4253 domain-containing protein n=1 Tax=Pseudoflavonifractor phocaeensis TaxID=1870988 RepID=UPI0030B8BE17
MPEQPAPSKPEAPAVEGTPKAAVPPAAEKAPTPGAEQPAPPKQDDLKGKDNPTPSKEDRPQSGKTDQQATIPGMGDPTPAGKVVDFTAARDGTAKGKPPEKVAAPDKGKQPEAPTPRRGRPPKEIKCAPGKASPRDKKSQGKGAGLSTPAKKKDSRTSGGGKATPTVEPKPPLTEQPTEPRDATRPVKEEIVYLDLSELHAFKDHPFEVRDDAEMQALVESVKTGGVNQPALVRPREGGGYEIVAGHRRQKASELAGYLPFGDWNECPDTQSLMAVAKYWFEQYGAVPAVMTHDELEFLLPTPVSQEKAMDAAVEQYGFCPDVIDQGPEEATVGALADVLRQSTVWYFWWD